MQPIRANPGPLPGALSSGPETRQVAGGLPFDFDAVYEEYFDFVWRTARRLGVPDASAEDVAQDVFLVVHRRQADYEPRTPIKYWVFGIVSRVVADHRRTYWRKEARNLPLEVDLDGGETHPATGPTPNEQAEHAEAFRLVVRLLDELDSEKREVMVLAQFEEMSAVEIAECLGLNVNTVYGRLRAARQAFDAAYVRHRARAAKRAP
jgi:RNA polymerase sigma-70 factor (ECF subfamily)